MNLCRHLMSQTKQIFDRIAPIYDAMNRILSLGQDHVWRRMMLGYLPWSLYKRLSIVDMACGTGALSALILQEAALRDQDIQLWMVDPSQAMLNNAQESLHGSGGTAYIQTICACAEDVPIPCERADVYVCAFGLRNMDNRTQSMKEAHRILRSDGTLIILEFSHEVSPHITIPYHYYLRYGLPWLGKHVAHDEAAYQYLADSIAAFPSPTTIITELARIGFVSLRCIPIHGGVVQLYYAKRSRTVRYQRKRLCGSTR